MWNLLVEINFRYADSDEPVSLGPFRFPEFDSRRDWEKRFYKAVRILNKSLGAEKGCQLEPHCNCSANPEGTPSRPPEPEAAVRKLELSWERGEIIPIRPKNRKEL